MGKGREGVNGRIARSPLKREECLYRRGFRRREVSKEDEAKWRGRPPLTAKAGEFPFLLCFYPFFPLAGRPLLLHSCPIGAAVAGTLLLLSAQGKEQRKCGDGWEGWLYSRVLGWLVCVLCPKAVLACINISSMRQMFFQMQELPQLWRISRMDFVRNGSITPDCSLPLFQHPQPLSWTKA